MNVELDRIIDKVKKCLALSKSDNPHEAAAALRQAQALMRKHGIDEAGIVASEVSAADVEHKSGNTARPPAWETMLMMLVGTAFGCKGLFVPAPKVNGRRGAGSYRYVGASADTRTLVRWAIRGLKSIYRPGYAYAKAGVMLSELRPRTAAQGDLFSAGGSFRSEALMATMDAVNSRWGRGSLRTAAVRSDHLEWEMARGSLSPGYTTDWEGLPVVLAR